MSELMNLLSDRKKKLESLRRRILEDIKSAPDGNLRVARKKYSPQYYLYSPETADSHPYGVYLNKDKTDIAAAVAQRDYGIKLLRTVEKQLKALSYLDRLSDAELFGVFEHQTECRKNLIRPYLIPKDKFVEMWLSSEYTGKGFDENASEFYSNSGIRVRSKSEKIIADYLSSKKIPYLYEKPLLLGNRTVYPDFTILDTDLRKEVYYEHFGRMDDPSYAETAIQKIHSYEKAGYRLGERLIVTFETKEHPLDSGMISGALERFVSETK
ncbi:MAG: hypothetical protein K6F53_01235 [Lachnospiraceae bacterium]|nr:hypothetical protein [Lachnospiraceae bacterium]